MSVFLSNLWHKSFYNFKIICYNYLSFKDNVMNNKVKILVATMAVGMAATMAGCGGCLGCSGCGGKSETHTLTRSNWFTGTSYNGIQPSFIEGHEKFSPEVITYEVSYDGTNASNAYYEVNYTDGVFTTQFYAVKNWSGKVGEIPKDYTPKNVNEVVYYYRTELTISVQYTMKTGGKAQSDIFNDHVITESYFRAAGKSLQPVYSKQEIKSTSPANYQPKNLEDAYKKIDVTYENFYNDSCTKLLSKTTENGKTEQKEYEKLNKLDHTLFDNSSLYIAVRAMKLSSNLSEPVNLFSAAAGGIAEYAIVGSQASLTAQERADYTKALTEKGLYAPKNDNDKVGATAVTISYAGGNLHGTTQTVWYAAITDADNNISRTTMLKLSVPLSFNLGSLNYSLKEINSTLWNS